ncbi:MAG TPA: cell envelope biogenesis protein OmpA [Flavobacteriaceae bacterium]|nr:cell envelope biogenesis protein OmpA [Flavobacteriaceae bacterium]HIP26838.1 cell envelope biogenesis protein OmpA [Flavobacteriaceae bacterium]
MKKIIILFIVIFSLNSCVSKRLYEDLDNKYNRLKNQNSNLVGENDKLFSTTKDLENENKKLKSSVDSLSMAKSILQNDVTALDEKKRKLQALYDELSQSSTSQLDAKASEILALSNQLNNKENALIAESTRLEKIKSELASRSERVKQLEELIAAKEAKMQQLKTAVSNALRNFEGKGLTVYRKNGKVYVSMENKLLFSSGSWAVGNQGKSAIIELAKVLKQNVDIEVLIEGHTDNVPYNGNNAINDNWDLSTKRATAIVRILVNHNVNSQRVTAAGRGEFVPVASNTTKAGRAKNRRIEVILAPNLDAINNLLE